MDALARLLADVGLDIDRALLLGALGAGRVLPVFLLAPFFGGRLVPLAIRAALAFAFVALLYPALDAGAPAALALGPMQLAALVAKELAIGTMLAFLVSLPFFAAEAAGRLIDTVRSANLAEVIVPQTGAPSSPLGDLGLQLAVIVFFALDGHLIFLRSLALSYDAVPLLAFPGADVAPVAATLAMEASGRLLIAAVGLAAPVVAALFLAELALGLLSRAAPQLQLHAIGMPLKSIAAILVLFASFGAMVTALGSVVGGGLTDVVRALSLWR